MKSKVMAFVAVAFLACGVAGANDSSLKAEIEDLKAKIAGIESAQMAPAAGGDAMSLTSMKKKGSIKIGGSVEIDIAVVKGERLTHKNDTNTLNDNDQYRKTYFGTGLPYDSGRGAYLDFEIAASKDSFLYIKLDLDDFWSDSTNAPANNAVQQDDLLEEVYFRWNNVRCSNWDIVFGKKVVDYGQDKFVGVMPSFHDGWAYGLFGDAAVTNEATATIGSNSFPTAPYNAFQVEAVYHWKDLVNVYATVFQDPGSRGMHEDRSDDTLFFESWALKVEYMPIEGLVLEASMINRHNDSSEEGTDENEDNQYAFSLGADYTFKCLPLNIWGEYQHGFDWGYFEDVDVDVLGIGATYGICENIDLSVLAEWANVSHPNGTLANVQVEEEDYYQAVLTGTYKFTTGISMSVEYARQWYEAELQGSGDGDRNVEIIAFRTAWSF